MRGGPGGRPGGQRRQGVIAERAELCKRRLRRPQGAAAAALVLSSFWRWSFREIVREVSGGAPPAVAASERGASATFLMLRLMVSSLEESYLRSAVHTLQRRAYVVFWRLHTAHNHPSGSAGSMLKKRRGEKRKAASAQSIRTERRKRQT